jgi:hypothetical protein
VSSHHAQIYKSFSVNGCVCLGSHGFRALSVVWYSEKDTNGCVRVPKSESVRWDPHLISGEPMEIQLPLYLHLISAIANGR